ncbi:MAG TPA: DUF4093 domain-containing protein, partial [Ruminococcus flavefaciens]|nr:DUF4093 domain-containing protein [Ruminococcus flavefaciens]
EKVKHAYIPDVFGKEKRKEKPSAEGKLGVEGIDKKLILEAFRKAGVTSEERTSAPDITTAVLYELGLSGGKNSSELRKRLQSSLGLPSLMSASALMEVLNTMMTADELSEHMKKLEGAENDL